MADRLSGSDGRAQYRAIDTGACRLVELGLRRQCGGIRPHDLVGFRGCRMPGHVLRTQKCAGRKRHRRDEDLILWRLGRITLLRERMQDDERGDTNGDQKQDGQDGLGAHCGSPRLQGLNDEGQHTGSGDRDAVRHS